MEFCGDFEMFCGEFFGFGGWGVEYEVLGEELGEWWSFEFYL